MAAAAAAYAYSPIVLAHENEIKKNTDRILFCRLSCPVCVCFFLLVLAAQAVCVCVPHMEKWIFYGCVNVPAPSTLGYTIILNTDVKR